MKVIDTVISTRVFQNTIVESSVEKHTPLLVAAALVMSMNAVQANAEAIEYSLSIDELENQFQKNHDARGWSVAFSAAKGNESINVISEGGHTVGDFEEHEMKAYYARAVTESSAVLIGWRGDMETEEHRHWFLTGYEFSAPMDIDVTTSLFWGSQGRVGFRLEAEKEFAIAEKLTLVPETKIHAHSRDDLEVGIASGFSDMEIAARLFYAVTPKFSTYIGASWGKSLGSTASYLRAENEDTSSEQFLLGLSYSF